MEAKIWKFVEGMFNTNTEMEKVRFELNLKITNFQLKTQPSTPLEVKEQREAVVRDGVIAVDVAVVECTALFE